MLRTPAVPLDVALTFRDRKDAGAQIRDALVAHGVEADLVLGLARGGLPVAAVIAESLGLPLDALVARKIGVPTQPELALGAVTRFGVVWNQDLIDDLGISDADLERARRRESAEVANREARYRTGRAVRSVAGQRVIVVDDGIATGATLAAAVASIVDAGATAVLVTVPVASVEGLERIRALGVEVLALATPRMFGAVGAYYVDFAPVSDETCVALLRRHGA